ncbi:hypothetical protein [Marinobacter halophilus]|uniref:Uncharacterized protein n=1 Tax=Marinobacter halophilus TaxID=1323740 RepID=A0A2T1KBX9_9GAMM|nr:hypothetical protein [Marinobacter halophilus]PSF07637.1 hypothetical protein C7H08_12130 [Marinobacter halophilus]GGC56101.1 hypothetical protein GCM10011362_00460 [Marinobacter halophilus]
MAEPALFRTHRRRSALWLAVIALVVAVLVAARSQPQPVEERLVRLHAQAAFGARSELLAEPLPVQALLLDYREDVLLLLKAQAALQVFPEHSRLLMELFGEEPEFQDALRTHGEYLIPPVIHFYQNPVGSIEMMNRVAGTRQTLTPEERAWFAINFANKEGHDFTGQFLVGPDSSIEWIWTERITEGVTQFFTSGIRTLESRYRTDLPIRASDLGWAAVDALVIGSAVKFLKAGRAAATTARASTVTARSAAYTSRLARAGRMASVMVSHARWPAVAALAYVAVRHPLVLNDLFAGAAKVLGVPPWMVQVPGWFIILLPILLLLRWLGRICLWFVPARRSRVL